MDDSYSELVLPRNIFEHLLDLPEGLSVEHVVIDEENAAVVLHVSGVVVSADGDAIDGRALLVYTQPAAGVIALNDIIPFPALPDDAD